MMSSFNPHYLDRHDLIYDAPPVKGSDAFLLGGGTWGGPLWCTETGIKAQWNHTDLYDSDAPAEGLYQGSVSRHLGRLSFDTTLPLFDWLYLKSFQARVSLRSSSLKISSESAFGLFHLDCVYHATRSLMALKITCEWNECVGPQGVPLTISLERWGSRVCGWWFSELNGIDPSDLGSATVAVNDATALLNVEFPGSCASIAARIDGSPSSATIIHDKLVRIEVPANRRQSFNLLISCASGQSAAETEKRAHEEVFAVSYTPALLNEHYSWWDAYWRKSFIRIANDYWENLYYLHLFYMGSCGRGLKPALFNGSLWTWNRDVRSWAFPHHWNQQQAYWFSLAANHPELLVGYLSSYSKILGALEEYAKSKGFSGILLSEVHDFEGKQLGENSEMMKENLTPASQVALFFWWYFQHTQDREFLLERTLPVLEKVALFFLNWVKTDDDGTSYYLPLSTTYEDERRTADGRLFRFVNSITCLAMCRSILSATEKACRVLGTHIELADRCARVLAGLPRYEINTNDEKRGITLSSGLLHGEKSPMSEDHNHGPLFAPVFPAGDLGLKNQGCPLFLAAVNTLATYPPHCNAITPTIIVAARLGMIDEAQKRIHSIVSNLQQYPNGCFYNIDHWFLYSRRCEVKYAEWAGMSDMSALQRDWIEDSSSVFPSVAAKSSDQTKAPTTVDVPTQPFTQPGLEPHGHLCAGLQEMLLQSHEGQVRVFPCVPDEWPCSFSLSAQGGFLVSAARRPFLQPHFVMVTSRSGNRFSLLNPWAEAVSVWQNGIKVSTYPQSSEIVFETENGQTYVVAPASNNCPESDVSFEHVINTQPKALGHARLGLPKNY